MATRKHPQRALGARLRPLLAGLGFTTLLIGCAANPATSPAPRQTVAEPALQVRSVGWAERRIQALAAAMPELQSRHDVAHVAVALVSVNGEDWSQGFDFSGGRLITPGTRFSADALAMPLLASLTLAGAETGSWTVRTALGQIAPRSPGGRNHAQLTPLSVLSTPYPDGSAGQRIALASALESTTASGLMAQLNVLTGAMTDSELAVAASDLRLSTSAADYAAYLRWLLVSEAGRATLPALLSPHATVNARAGLFQGLGWALERQPEGGVTGYQWSHAAGHHHFAMLDPRRQRAIVILTRGQHGRSLIAEALPLIDATPHALLNESVPGR